MALNIQQQRIGAFLAQGLKPAQITSIVGVSAGYISQLLSEDGPEEFKSFVQEKAAAQQKDVDEDALVTAKYVSLEHKLLGAIEGALLGAELPALTNALKAISDRQEKRLARKAGIMVPQGTSNVFQNITVLNLPAHAVPEYQVNGQGQVLAVDGRGLNPMNSNAVKQMFKGLKAPLVIPEEKEIGQNEVEQRDVEQNDVKATQALAEIEEQKALEGQYIEF